MDLHILDWHVEEMVALLRQRYPAWESFDHKPFVADEISPKRAAAESFQEDLGRETYERLLAQGQHDEIVQRLRRVGTNSKLIFNRVPRQGDLRLLYDEGADRPVLTHHIRDLLFGNDPTPARFDRFARYVFETRQQALRWPLPTLFLFLHRPESEFLIQPRPAAWFVSFLGHAGLYTATPHGAAYAAIRDAARALGNALAPYGARDLIDVQSFLWVTFRQSAERTGGLDVRGQVELDVPRTRYGTVTAQALMREKPENEYNAAPAEKPMEENPPYSLSECATDTYLPESTLAGWVAAIERKKQAVFFGPPGTGKTYIARALARHLAGGGDGVIRLIQFHPAYAYEDFIQGIRPVTRDGVVSYETVPGLFLRFCQAAAGRTGRSVLVIDEMNRADLARVFGELMYLLEYRDQEIPLAGGGTLRIPENVRLLGTMNSADRSIALVDYALRRRFAFVELLPDAGILRRYHAGTGYDPEPLIGVLERINTEIGDPHYAVGISYFLHPDLDPAILQAIWQLEIEPYLGEYFFDQPEVVDQFRWEAVGGGILPKGQT